jgi:hypothetical protein
MPQRYPKTLFGCIGRKVKMKRKLDKILRSLVLGVLLFAVCSSEPNALLARTRKREKVQAKKTITKFLSSVNLTEKAYSFDHNGDGLTDMSVYPLKTENPDLKTKYVTLEEAIRKKQLVLKENPKLSDIGRDPPSSYSVFAQYWGSQPLYSPRGGQMRGGWQNRGLGRGGVMGGGYGYSGYGRRGYSGRYGSGSGRYGRGLRRYFRFGGFSGIGLGYSDSGGLSLAGIFGSVHNKKSSEPAKQRRFEVDALCFEKWRLIEESRRLGKPEYFSYAGMAGPHIRKELVLFPNQINAHKAIEKELRRLGVHSKTKAMADVFDNQKIKKIIDYYVADSKYVLDKNKGISGMIVTSRNRILCADIYSSPDLFEKMFSQLMQSAALGVYKTRQNKRKHLGRNDVEKFLYDLKQVQKLKKETSQTYKLCCPTLVSEAELYSDENGIKLVHLEAYPR